jgi:plastocyanin
VHVAAPIAAGFGAGAAFIAVFVIWVDEPPIYRVASLGGPVVTIPEGASTQEANFVPQTASIDAGNFVNWVNEETVPTTVVIEAVCEPLHDNGATVTSSGTERLLMSGESFSCLFKEAGEYHVHTEPWPWMQGTVRVSP